MTADAEGRTWARVLQTLPITVTSGGSEIRPSTMLAYWSEDDPAAVKLTIEDPWTDGQTVEWEFGRNLLTAALLPGYGEIVGVGDVRVRYHGGRVAMGLSSPEGECVLSVYGELIIGFLHETYRVIDPGSIAESVAYTAHLDAELAALVGGSA